MIAQAIDLLDRGEKRIAEVVDSEVVVHEWLKRAILLLFRRARMVTHELGPFEFADRIPLKSGYEAAGVRVVPGASARWGSFLDRGVVLMPSYVNIGARVGARSMVDTWATVGSCAQIGHGAMLGAGVILNPSIPVIDGETGEEVSRGVVPPWCLAINATRPKQLPGGTFGFPCVLIIKRFAEGERHSKATLNTVLREHGIAI